MNIDRNPRTRARLLMALPIAAMAFSLAACSGAVERPSVDEVSSGFQQILESVGQGDAFSDTQLDCMAGVLVDSEVSDQDLKNIADGKDEQTSQEAKELVEATTQAAVTECTSPE